LVPRFYFDIRADGKFLPDEEGTELPDLDAAEREAAEAAAEMGRDSCQSAKAAKSSWKYEMSTASRC
jgi:hypothetical protein